MLLPDTPSCALCVLCVNPIQSPAMRRLALFLLFAACAFAQQPTEADATLRAFRFSTGEIFDVTMHYRTLGKLQGNNAVLILHGTTGSGDQFINERFAGELFGPGQPLDSSKFFIISPDNLGHGRSTRPSEGLRARFPRYGYRDMIAAQHRLLTERLGVNHLRLVIGTSMGGMHAWLWGSMHPDFMDALLPLASLPTQISGRNRLWRRILIDAIRNDPQWQGGNYVRQPQSLRTAAQMLMFMSSNPVRRQSEMPSLAASDAAIDKYVDDALRRLDANDVLYAVEASWDYDPAPGLEKITAPLLAINFADDLINPPELGILEREIKRVKHGRAITLPMSELTVGHGTHTSAAIWKHLLVRLLEQSNKQ